MIQSFSRSLKTGLMGSKQMRFLNLHEYQAAELLQAYNVPILMGKSASNAEDALTVAKEIEKKSKTGLGLVVKAQIHAGGRGRGTFKESGLVGGVHLVPSSAEVSSLFRFDCRSFVFF